MHHSTTFAADQMKIFLQRSLAIFKYKMAICRPKIDISGPFWHLRDRKVLNNILKWLILCTIVQLFAVDQMKLFLERSMAISKSKIVIFRPKMAIIGPFWHLRDIKVYNNILKWMIPDSIVQPCAAYNIFGKMLLSIISLKSLFVGVSWLFKLKPFFWTNFIFFNFTSQWF